MKACRNPIPLPILISLVLLCGCQIKNSNTAGSDSARRNYINYCLSLTGNLNSITVQLEDQYDIAAKSVKGWANGQTIDTRDSVLNTLTQLQSEVQSLSDLSTRLNHEFEGKDLSQEHLQVLKKSRDELDSQVRKTRDKAQSLLATIRENSATRTDAETQTKILLDDPLSNYSRLVNDADQAISSLYRFLAARESGT